MAAVGVRGCSSAAASASSSPDQQRPGAGLRSQPRHAVGAGVGAVRRPEGVHHENFAQRRHPGSEVRIVGLFAAFEAHVFKQRRVPRLDLHALRPGIHQRDRTDAGVR